MIDHEKARRETLRWLLLVTLNSARPIGAAELLLFQAVRDPMRDVTPREIRIELDYLEERDLVEIEGRDIAPQWRAKLTRHGMDVAEYTVVCEPGIARPAKYW